MLGKVMQQVSVPVSKRRKTPHRYRQILLIEIFGLRETLRAERGEGALVSEGQGRKSPKSVTEILRTVMFNPGHDLAAEPLQKKLVLPMDRCKGPDNHCHIARRKGGELLERRVCPMAAPSPLAVSASHFCQCPCGQRQVPRIETGQTSHCELEEHQYGLFLMPHVKRRDRPKAIGELHVVAIGCVPSDELHESPPRVALLHRLRALEERRGVPSERFR
mmetsp:Transcript_48667/g.136049  ORF Transcript_48667/g.136049 Transcript_48667/m.136049 type:complete len:219 (-) Transcript_48667:354-1010(-)